MLVFYMSSLFLMCWQKRSKISTVLCVFRLRAFYFMNYKNEDPLCYAGPTYKQIECYRFYITINT